jgi:hypothetical protein
LIAAAWIPAGWRQMVMDAVQWEDRVRYYGFSKRDLERIKDRSVSLSPTHIPAAFADLDAPWRVSVVPKDHANYYSGQLVGTFNGCAVIAWPKS